MPSEVKSPAPARDVDERGRVLPATPEERAARIARARAALARIEAMAVTPEWDASWREVVRGVDEGRPHRKLFEGVD